MRRPWTVFIAIAALAAAIAMVFVRQSHHAAIAVTPSAAHAATNGPDPTVSSLRASAGPYSLSRTVYADGATPGFGAATVFAPAGAPAGQTFGVVAFAPGWTENSSSVSWLAQKVASYGFVTIAFNVNNTFTDFPASRANQLLAALDPDQVWGVVDARTKPRDSARWLTEVGERRRVDALAVRGLFETTQPGTVLDLGVPVAWFDGIPATGVAWAAALSQHLQPGVRWD